MGLYKYIKVEIDRYICKVVLARAEKRNAFTPTMVNEINHVFQKVNVDDAIKVVLIEAEGPVFCAGMDLKTFEDAGLDEVNPTIINKNISLGEVFERLYKPSIAIVEGNVIAGGFLIALGCTYVFATPEVKFRLPELDLGIFPFQVMASLLKIMSEKQVLQLCLDTGYFDFERARNLGLVDGILDRKELDVLIGSFENKSVRALKEGIKSLRTIKSIPAQDQFTYLKEVLDNLKRG
ncbi:MAG: enoyl-CoA hydratase/isomerase family protein [Sphingobacterium sp.]|jgi:methylglutaconyl-CoA hydratase|nr:enoyl-CoA hydratase/isomerase family protein [Sphingobacterium sp.]